MDLRTFLLAGRSTLTVTSKKTGTRFTYRVRRNDDKPDMFFVSVLTGPDNTWDYSYAGILREQPSGRLLWAHTRGSKVERTAPSWMGFQWLVSRLNAGKESVIEEHAEVHHEGRCGRCGRALTVPESIESGFGPECITKVFN